MAEIGPEYSEYNIHIIIPEYSVCGEDSLPGSGLYHLAVDSHGGMGQESLWGLLI